MREAGLVPADNTVVVSLDSWNYGRRYMRCVVPPDLRPEEGEFSFVAGLEVVVAHPASTAIERRNALLRELLKCRPVTLLVFTMGEVIRMTWIKSRAVGIELEEFQ